MLHKRATRPAGFPTAIDEDTTAAEVAEAITNLAAAARVARERGNDLRIVALHADIDEKLEVWQVLNALEGPR